MDVQNKERKEEDAKEGGRRSGLNTHTHTHSHTDTPHHLKKTYQMSHAALHPHPLLLPLLPFHPGLQPRKGGRDGGGRSEGWERLPSQERRPARPRGREGGAAGVGGVAWRGRRRRRRKRKRGERAV